jgi:hypothetical protein
MYGAFYEIVRFGSSDRIYLGERLIFAMDLSYNVQDL